MALTVDILNERVAGGMNICECRVTVNGITQTVGVQGYSDNPTAGLAEVKADATRQFKVLKAAGAFTASKVHPTFPASFTIDEKDLEPGVGQGTVEP